MKYLWYTIVIATLFIPLVWLATDRDFTSDEQPTEQEKSIPAHSQDIRQMIVGSWDVLNDTEQYTEFYDNGDFRDMHDAGEIRRGTWSLKKRGTNSGTTSTQYQLHVVFAGDTYTYDVMEVNNTSLTLRNIAHGRLIHYDRIGKIQATKPPDPQ